MSFPGPLLDHLKSTTTKQGEHLHQLPSNKAAKKGIDTTGGKKVTGLANPVAWGHVITIFRVIKGLLHKVCKADAIGALKLLVQQSGQGGRVFLWGNLRGHKDLYLLQLIRGQKPAFL